MENEKDPLLENEEKDDDDDDDSDTTHPFQPGGSSTPRPSGSFQFFFFQFFYCFAPFTSRYNRYITIYIVHKKVICASAHSQVKNNCKRSRN